LADETVDCQHKIEIAEVEREYLFEKLLEYEPHLMDGASSTSNGVEKREYKRKNSSSTSESLKPMRKKLKLQAKMVRKIPVQQTNISSPSSVTGIPKAPCKIDGINVIIWGTILDRTYNTEHSIYPTNYKIVRNHRGKNFICKILDNGSSPLFQIHTTDDVKNVYAGSTASEAYEKMQVYYPSNGPNYYDGESFFGLKNKRIRDYINLLPNAKRITKVKEEDFFDQHNYSALSM
jgi:hypothetical protein